MLKGMSRYALNADTNGRKRISLRANMGRSFNTGNTGNFAPGAPQTLTGTTSPGSAVNVSMNAKKNIERYERDILQGIIDYQNSTSSRRLQNDMYFHDSIAGTVCDIRSKIPFSNFELAGTESKERRAQYTSSVNAMQIRSMLPKIALERMVEGAHVSYMNFDDVSKKFTSIIPHNPEYLTVTPVPIYGRDPLINVNYPDHILNCVKSEDPDMRNELERYAEDLLEMIKEKNTRLDPKFTLYLARTPFAWSPYGVSYLRRLIPIWLYEKALARGTIDLAGRRQKALMHIIMGDDEWLPTNEQLRQITQLFIDADNDSVGAMVATRPGIETNELRAGQDHWRWDEAWDSFTTAKLKGLGVPDAIFGDFTAQVAEQTISSFLEDMIAEREDLTQRIFYNKMFLIIADENDFKKSEKQKEITGSDDKDLAKLMKHIKGIIDSRDRITAQSQHVLFSADEALDPAEYDLPQVRYEKSLKISGNDALFNNLGTLAERGMPTALRYQMALLGVPAEDMFAALPQDLEDRQVISDYMKKLPQLPAQEGEGGGDDGGGSNMFMESSNLRRIVGSDLFAKIKPNRSFDHIERRDPKTGKVLSKKGRQVQDDKDNKILMEAAARVRAKRNMDDRKSDRKHYYGRKY